MKVSHIAGSRTSRTLGRILARFIRAGAFRRTAASFAAIALIVPLLIAFQTTAGAPAANAGGSGGTVTSADGRITATKTASTYSLPLGGGTVTYTYTLKNNTGAREYFVSGSDDKCGTPSSSGLSSELFNPYSYIPAGATVTFTCTQTVTVTTTNTATFTFNTSCGLFGCSGASSTVAPKATVDVQVPTYTCDTIWYGSLNNNGGGVGSLGTLLPSSTLVRNLTAPGQPTGFDNTSAIAINPLAPNYIYYTPRTTATTFSTALYRYDTVSGTETQVASGASLVAFQTNRLAFDAGGTLWSVANNGLIYSWTEAGGVSAGKTVTASNGVNFATLASGDIAFDGIGNMWVLVADSVTGTTYLYTISAASLATSTPQAQLVGIMSSPTGSGATFYNGIAFDTNGNLYASANSGSTNNGNTWYLYTINKDTGATTQTATGTGRGTIGDLASCALPKPQLTAIKTVSPSTPAKVGDTLTYTIKVSNIGNLSATGVTFQDLVPAGTTYVAGSTTLNGASIADSGGMPYTTTREIHGSTTVNAGVIPAGDSATIMFKVTVNASAGSSVSNQGTTNYVGGTPLLTDDPSKPGSTDPTVTAILRPAIDIIKTASATTLTAPGTVTYTYAVTTGTGNEPVKNVVLSDDKCTVPATHTGDANSNNILDPGETWNFTCTQTISTTTTNTATVTGTGISTDLPVSDTAQATVTVLPPNLNVTKTAGTVTGPDADGNLVATYTITIANTGNGQGSYGALTDTPAFASNLAVTGAAWTTSGTGAPAGGSSSGPGPYALAPSGSTIGPGVTQVFNLSVTFHYTNTSQVTECAGPGTGLFNSVALPSGQEQGPITDNSACDTVLPKLVASKTVDPTAGTLVETGQLLAYSLTFDNTAGTAPATVSHTDWLGDVLDASSFVAGSITTTTTSGNPLQVADNSNDEPETLAITGTVAAGAKSTITYQVKVNEAGALEDALLENYLTPSSTTAPPTSCPAGSTTCTVNPVGSWTLAKTASPPSGTAINPGDPAADRVITYTVTATNSTGNTITDIILTDDLSKVLNNAAFTSGSASLSINGGTPIAVPDPGTGATLVTPPFTLPGNGSAVLSYSVTVNADAWLARLENGVTGDAVIAPERCVTGSTDALDPACSTTNPTTGHLFVQKAEQDPTQGTTVPLTGSSFEIHEDSAGQMGTTVIGTNSAVSGSPGLVEIRDLLPGTYWLLETKAPDGYSLLAAPVKFTIGSDGVITVDAATAGPSVTVDGLTITVLDMAAVTLPTAGGPGPAGLYGAAIAGMLLLMISLLLLRRRVDKTPQSQIAERSSAHLLGDNK